MRASKTYTNTDEMTQEHNLSEEDVVLSVKVYSKDGSYGISVAHCVPTFEEFQAIMNCMHSDLAEAASPLIVEALLRGVSPSH